MYLYRITLDPKRRNLGRATSVGLISDRRDCCVVHVVGTGRTARCDPVNEDWLGRIDNVHVVAKLVVGHDRAIRIHQVEERADKVVSLTVGALVSEIHVAYNDKVEKGPFLFGDQGLYDLDGYLPLFLGYDQECPAMWA